MDLKHSIKGSRVELTWSIPKKERRLQSDIIGFRVYQSKLTLSEAAECENCPLEFTRVGDIAVVKEETGDPITYSEPLNPGYSYTYIVKSYSENGMVSADSNEVKFEFQ
jgi:hypothetical protein